MAAHPVRGHRVGARWPRRPRRELERREFGRAAAEVASDATNMTCPAAQEQSRASPPPPQLMDAGVRAPTSRVSAKLVGCTSCARTAKTYSVPFGRRHARHVGACRRRANGRAPCAGRAREVHPAFSRVRDSTWHCAPPQLQYRRAGIFLIITFTALQVIYYPAPPKRRSSARRKPSASTSNAPGASDECLQSKKPGDGRCTPGCTSHRGSRAADRARSPTGAAPATATRSACCRQPTASVSGEVRGAHQPG